MRKLWLVVLFFNGWLLHAQPPLAPRLDRAVRHLLADTQCLHATTGFCVADGKTGKVIYAYNAGAGLAPASTQKLFTSIAALDLLGSDYRYRTTAGYSGQVNAGVLKGNLYITGSGDPTLGSWRWEQTKESVVLKKIINALQAKGIRRVDGDICLVDTGFSRQPIPGGWIWDDIGNYYGAGCWGINWHENQYDLQIRPGSNPGDSTAILQLPPQLKGVQLVNGISTGAAGSGDNAYIYLPPYSQTGFTTGTVPPGKAPFLVTGSVPDAPLEFGRALQSALAEAQVSVTGSTRVYHRGMRGLPALNESVRELVSVYSPSLDSIVYWFLKKSINLYGEALLKTIARMKTGEGATAAGTELVKGFWEQRGIEKTAIDIQDGSGLSPQNRVTASAEVRALLYAKQRPWFAAFYTALPEFNGMKMKSGSIGGARAFAGYHRAHNGSEYVFSIIINNYSGPPAQLVAKLFKVLDELK